MKRREFVTLLGSAAVWPFAARAQQPAMPVIGFLHASSPDPIANRATAFRKGLSDMGYVEGRNVAIEFCWAHNNVERLRELAVDLVRRRVAVIATPGSVAAALAAKSATATIPIVFQTGMDPVEAGLVSSLNRPGGNVTGVSSMNADLVTKQVGLLNELLPRAVCFAVLVNPNYLATESIVANMRDAAEAIGRQVFLSTLRIQLPNPRPETRRLPRSRLGCDSRSKVRAARPPSTPPSRASPNSGSTR